MNDKGQIVIPAEARAELDMQPGSRLMIMASPFARGVVVVKSELIEERLRDISDALGKLDVSESGS
jgi:bifunctional DNA-binding transcriptional regulator/antitoxin component of YhaV-PrlF toxin-antitoxin module